MRVCISGESADRAPHPDKRRLLEKSHASRHIRVHPTHKTNKYVNLFYLEKKKNFRNLVITS